MGCSELKRKPDAATVILAMGAGKNAAKGIDAYIKEKN